MKKYKGIDGLISFDSRDQNKLGGFNGKKHYMCTHTWATTEAEKAFLENTKGMTDK